MTTVFGFRLGAHHLLGGSVARIVIVGSVYRDGALVPKVSLACADYGRRLITLVGNQTYAIGPEVRP